ncbi:SpvB/TcaC N-terminal domain-containing protein, partial [Taibaiella soli]
MNQNSSYGNNGGHANPLDRYTNQPAQKKDDSPFYQSAAPSISLPKGGGALKGIDEKFSVNAVNGTANVSIPLPLSPGRSGFTPALSLSYSSGSGNSEFGLGWALSLPAIQRRTDKKLPQYNDIAESDVFLLAGAEDLVPELNSDNTPVSFTDGNYQIKRYIPRIEGLFARIELICDLHSTNKWWRVTTKDNSTTYYGLSESARIADPTDVSRIFKWLPELTVDHKGNVQWFCYVPENDKNIPIGIQEKNRQNGLAPFTNTYLKSVLYCNQTPYFIAEADMYQPVLPAATDFLMEGVLDYGDHSSEFVPVADQVWSSRPDAFSDFHAGFEIRTYRRCQRVMMFHYFAELNGKNLVRALELQYQSDLSAPVSGLMEADLIVSATQKGYTYQGGEWHSKALPAMSFDYQALQWSQDLQRVNAKEIANAPQGLTGAYQWIDFEGEGISGILTETTGAWMYKSNEGDGQFAPARTIARKPSFNGLSDGSLQWADLDADGRRQVVSVAPVSGYFELDDDQNWQPFRAFTSVVNIDRSSPYTKMLDLDGDGRPDILITEDRVWTWYQNNGTKGWDKGGQSSAAFDENKGPRLLLNDNVQRIFLADMNGDGMTDIVRIQNGDVCYWPNMGYGGFGAKVTMANAPRFARPDLFNPIYLQLADISGTGAADLIYLEHNKCTAWINLSGNGWSTPQPITTLPSIEAYSKIAVLDFLGNGTGCLVWSSPLPQHAMAPIQYVDLMGGIKPYLMRSYNNGMGKTVSVDYKSSTQYYLADKHAGTPWATRLPFPVHCISNITTQDSVSETSYTQTYQYRNGYYDHEEREFRGFGYVATTDIDSAVAFDNAALDQSPVLTKTWYHTGAWLREDSLLDAYKKEYYQFEGWDDLTTIATFATLDMTGNEIREAHRALKGSPLRQEVYALDGSTEEAVPYSITATAYTVTRFQPKANNRYASFLSYQQQSIAFACERNADDPRIQHSLTLETDQWANVTKSASVVYPRLHTDASLPQIVQDEQAKMHIVYTENSFTNDVITDYERHLRMPLQVKTWEMLGVFTPPTTALWQTSDLLTACTIATEIDFSATPTGASEKRLLSAVRTRYKANTAVDTPLLFGELESLAIPHEHYQLALTPQLASYCYNGYVDNGKLQEAGFVDLDSDGKYWLPSGTMHFDTPQQHFYTPTTFNDPWGNITTVSFGDSTNAYNYWLLPQSVTDAIVNTNGVATYDWRILQPLRMRDANLNYSEILYDALGLPIAMALKGKDDSSAPEGDSLDGLDIYSNADQLAQSDFFALDPAANANALLQNATWRCVYDLSTTPVSVGMIARQKHVHDTTSIVAGQTSDHLIRLSYTDGLGRLIMHKMQCENLPATNGVILRGCL